jgi:chemotaxis protein MotA
VLTTASTGTLIIVVIAAVVLQIAVPGSGFVAVIAGFLLVCCGTLLMARLSHSGGALRGLLDTLREVRAARGVADHDELRLQWFLRAANFFRYGNIRPAEEAARHIPAPVLRRGTQLVLDGFQRPQLTMALQRQIAEERERLVAPVELLRAMAGYAPTLGMLGTLLGLLQMLFGVGSGDMESMGTAMGFAMMTTVFGLVIANLILKPLAAKVEQCNRRRLTQNIADVQAVMLLHERQHPEYIREVIHDARSDGRSRPRLAAVAGTRV